jgi:hypothetical protein
MYVCKEEIYLLNFDLGETVLTEEWKVGNFHNLT